MKPIIQAGLELITVIKTEELAPQELINILHSLVTKDWTLIHKIIATAVEKKLIERGGSVYRILPDGQEDEVRTSTIRSRKERGVCSLCGKQLHICFFVDVGSRTYGPFGSTCVRKLKLVK